MKVYLVGGAVRDKLIGVPVKDCDYVVIGATVEHMLSQGFRQVGADFPVFLHPESGEEYALARRERKTGAGYNGFECEFGRDVTLEEDLFRRDLTMNALAMDDAGNIIDPYGGRKDLENGVLRHVSKHFSEDPVRILRVARFAARYGFSIAEETLGLMAGMVAAGEFDSLTPERIWKEVSRAMTEEKPSLFWQTLQRTGGLGKLPGMPCECTEVMLNLDSIRKEDSRWQDKSRLALSLMDNLKVVEEGGDGWRIDSDTLKYVKMLSRNFDSAYSYEFLSVVERVSFLNATTAMKDESAARNVIEDACFAKNLFDPGRHVSAMLKDVGVLRSLDLAAVSKKAKEEQLDVKGLIEQAKIDALTGLASDISVLRRGRQHGC